MWIHSVWRMQNRETRFSVMNEDLLILSNIFSRWVYFMLTSPTRYVHMFICKLYFVFHLIKNGLKEHNVEDTVQALSHVRIFATPWIAARQASLSITISRSSLKLMSIELGMPSSYLILCCPLLLLPPIPPSIRIFSNESTLCMMWPKLHKLESRLVDEISITSDMQMTPPLWQKVKRN